MVLDKNVKALIDKLTKILDKLDLPADPQTVEILASIVLTVQATNLDIRELTFSDIVTAVQATAANLKATVTQAAKDRTITSLPLKGTPNRFYATASAELVAAPSTGNKLRVYGYLIVNESDEITRLRYGGVSGTVFAICPTKGAVGMNLVNIDEAGGDAENIFAEKSGSGNALVVVWIETVTI